MCRPPSQLRAAPVDLHPCRSGSVQLARLECQPIACTVRSAIDQLSDTDVCSWRIAFEIDAIGTFERIGARDGPGEEFDTWSR